MSKNLNRLIPQGGDVSLRLVLGLPQRGVKSAQNNVQVVERLIGQVSFASSVEVQFHKPKHSDGPSVPFKTFIKIIDFPALVCQLLFVDAPCDFKALRMIGDGNVVV